MAKTVKCLLTENDNETPDIVRYSWAGTITAFVLGAGWNAVHSGVVDLQAFAVGVSGIVGAHAAALWAKKDNPPGSK